MTLKLRHILLKNTPVISVSENCYSTGYLHIVADFQHPRSSGINDSSHRIKNSYAFTNFCTAITKKSYICLLTTFMTKSNFLAYRFILLNILPCHPFHFKSLCIYCSHISTILSGAKRVRTSFALSPHIFESSGFSANSHIAFASASLSAIGARRPFS